MNEKKKYKEKGKRRKEQKKEKEEEVKKSQRRAEPYCTNGSKSRANKKTSKENDDNKEAPKDEERAKTKRGQKYIIIHENRQKEKVSAINIKLNNNKINRPFYVPLRRRLCVSLSLP